MAHDVLKFSSSGSIDRINKCQDDINKLLVTYLTLLRTNSNDNFCVGKFALLQMASQGWLCKNTCRSMLKLMKDVERSIGHLSLHIRGSSIKGAVGWLAADFGG